MANREKEATFSPQVTIIIGTLNRHEILSKLLGQLSEESKKISLEVLVIDQSDLAQFDKFWKVFPKLDNFHIFHQKEKNICKYLNFGWKNAKAPIVLYLDDDVEISDKTISSYLQSYKDKSIMGVAGRVVNDGELSLHNIKVGTIDWYGAIILMNFNSDSVTLVDFPYGCNMSFRKKALEELSGFDEKLLGPSFSYMEVDLGFRLNKKWPKSLIFNPQALVYHHKHQTGGTRNNYSEKELFHCNQFNYGYFLGKNFSLLQNMVCFVRRLPYQLLRERNAIPSIIKGYTSSHATRGESNRKIVEQ